MRNKEDFLNLTKQEIINLPYDELVDNVNDLDENEFIKISTRVGYPVFTRLCMGKLKHKFIILQDGAAAIIVNKEGQILLQSRADRDKWGLPGGCQELGATFEETIIREIKEETNLDVKEEDLKLIGIISGSSRKNQYPNGDMVFNNTALYYIEKYSGNLQWDEESKEMKFFDIDSLPSNQNDPDLIKFYIKKKNSK